MMIHQLIVQEYLVLLIQANFKRSLIWRTWVLIIPTSILTRTGTSEVF